MKFNKLFAMFLAAGLGGWTMAALAAEESADSVDVGKVKVTGQNLGNGQMVVESAPKSRSTVTKEALDKMSATGNAIDKLKYTPGVNVSSDDSSGLSGFNFTMRGMNSDQVGVSLDGIPVNDSGNYNLYPNLLGDPENLGEVFATQGSSEIDAPHIGSSGGNVGLVTLRPEKDFGVFGKQTIGSNNLRKTFVRLNTGKYNGFSNYISASHTEGDKWRGEGVLRADKVTLNSLFEDGEGNSLNAVINYHKQENYNYSNPSKAQFKTYGRDFDYLDDPRYNSNGKIMTGSGSSLNGVTRGTGYSVLMRNPFENVTASLTGRFQLRDDVLLTVAPYYYWANGGSFGSFTGPYSLNRGTSNTGGNYDLGNLPTSGQLNADGTPNSGLYYRPSITETWRPGINTSIKWDINDEHSFSTGYWYERARQRQTQPFVPLTPDGKPVDIWAGYHDSEQARDANGNVIQGRNYFTVTPAHKLFAQDVWSVTPDLTLTAGIAYDYSERKGDNRGSLTEKKEKRNKTYHELLPSFSAQYLLDDENQVFYNLTRNMRTPPNYVLYNKGDSISLEPELSWNHEFGWRYAVEDMALSATLFYLTFENRQVSSRDEAGDYVMLNVGDVVNQGLELEWSGLLPHNFNYYASYTYTEAEQKDSVRYRGVDLPTEGKTVAGVPKNMLNLSLGYDDGLYYGNIVGKYVSRQYGDLTNDESIPDYAIADLNLGVHLPVQGTALKSAAVRLSVNNLFDKEYLSGVRTTQFNAVTYSQGSASAFGSSPYYTIGEERTVSVSFEGSF
ncbi:TonB-dependent receptor [Pseudomonas solani]|uniref:TonB-dependent receptor family protein n=1 Tax=Pseudomonas solani TaxID=2731552 RepID=UPI0035BEA474